MLNKADFNQLPPHAGKQAVIDTVRFVGVFIYLADLCMKIAYLRNSKWISVQVRDLYVEVMTIRPFFLLLYHFWFIIFEY